MTRAEIALAVPGGSRRARSQPEWLRRVQQEVAIAGLRADRAQNILWWAEVHARHASWEDRTSRPTRALTCQLAGFCASTYKACRAWLADQGLIGVVREGRVPDLRPMALTTEDEPNEAKVYVLAIPRRKSPPGPAVPPDRITRPLTASRSDPVLPRAHEAPFVARLVRQATGQDISDGWGAWLERPFRAAGWTDADLRHALDWPPDGRQHPYLTRGVRHPARWAMWRLRHWLDPDGPSRWRDATPLPSRSQRHAAQRAELAGRQAADRARRDALTAAAAGVTPEYVAARAALFPGLPIGGGPAPEKGR